MAKRKRRKNPANSVDERYAEMVRKSREASRDRLFHHAKAYRGHRKAGRKTHARSSIKLLRIYKSRLKDMAPERTGVNPGGKAILGIGMLVNLEVLNPSTGKSAMRSMRGKWLAWDPSKRCFYICSAKGRASTMLPSSVAAAHKRFHEVASSTAVMADVPAPVGQLTQVGLVKSLVYKVPPKVKSPGKNPYTWHHAFGDTGHKGGSDYPQKVMPALMRDQAGNLFIRRRPGNIFRVDTWLRG